MGLVGRMDKKWLNVSPHVQLLALLSANFVANFLFILDYKFYSDDWTTFVFSEYIRYPFNNLIMDSQRPLAWCFLRLEWLIFQGSPLGYHIISLLTSSVILILIYLLFKELLPRLGLQGEAYPFIAALAYAVLFNKDQLYPWAVIGANDLGVICYLLAFLLYIHRDRRRYFTSLSLVLYFLGLCIYEVGALLPAVLFLYDFFTRRDYKPAFLFAVPAAASFLIRFTDWLGFGHTFIPRGFGDLTVSSLPSHLFNVFYPLWAKALNNVYYGLVGLGSTDVTVLVFLLLLDVLIACLIFRLVDLKGLSGKASIKTVAFPLLMVAFLVVPHIIQGTMDTRHMVLVDIGYAILIAVFAGAAVRAGAGKVLLAALLVASLLLCQGLYVNWVISGDIQEHVSQYISKNAAEIGPYSYIYFNATSFADRRQNQYRAVIAEIAYRLRGGNETRPPGLVPDYYSYVNAKCLDPWSLQDMLQASLGPMDNRTVVYGTDDNEPIADSGAVLTYRNVTTGETFQVNRSSYFEITYDKVYATT